MNTKSINTNVKRVEKGSNIRIFNHKLIDCTSKDELMCLPDSYKYHCRSLGLTNPEDIILLHPDLRSYWNYIRAHYDRIGLSYTKNVIWNDDFDIIRKFPDYELSVYFFGDEVNHVRSDKNWYNIAQAMNSKNNFIRICRELLVNVPDTFCFNRKDELRNYNGFDFPVYIKISTSLSGFGVIKCLNAAELKNKVSLLKPEISFQIQKEIEAKSFINVQYVIEKNRCERVLISEQVLDGFKHTGNRFPTPYNDAWKLTDPLAMKMREEGMKGYFAFDLAVTNDDKYFAIECNPRYNGATYPTIISMKLGIRSWTAKNFKTDLRNFNEIHLEDIEYDPSKGSGIVIINWGCLDEGKLGILLAGTIEEQNRLEKMLEQKSINT